MNKLYFIIFFVSFFIPIKNGPILNSNSNFNCNSNNLTNILSNKYIFIHHPWNKHSQLIFNSLKELSPNNLIIIDAIHLPNPHLFFQNLSKIINNNISIYFPLLIKSNNNSYEIYNNNPSLKKLKKFLNSTNSNNIKDENGRKVYSKINYDFLNDIIFHKKDCLIIFYIKNKKSKNVIKRFLPKLNINMSCIAYTDIASKYSYKLFNILDGYESDLPCLRSLKFTNDKLFFTKKNNINLLDKNISNKIYDFINSTFNKKLFFHEYNSNNNIYNNKLKHKYKYDAYKCEIKKNVIDLYYNEWCEYCLELFILIEDLFNEVKYLKKYFKYEKHLVSYFPMSRKIEENKGNDYDLYFNFLPRLHINDIFINITYEFFGDYTKDNILNFMIDKINLLNNFQEIY